MYLQQSAPGRVNESEAWERMQPMMTSQIMYRPSCKRWRSSRGISPARALLAWQPSHGGGQPAL